MWWLFQVLRLVHLPKLATDLVRRILRPFATTLGLISGLWFVGVDLHVHPGGVVRQDGRVRESHFLDPADDAADFPGHRRIAGSRWRRAQQFVGF